MYSDIDAEVITRHGKTVHENLDDKIDRVRNSLWEALTDKQRTEHSRKFQDEQKIYVVLTDGENVRQSTELTVRGVYLDNTVPTDRSRITEALFDLDKVSKDFSNYLQKQLKDALLSIFTRATSETSTLVSWRRAIHRAEALASSSDIDKWSDDKNLRRCQLVDKEIAGTLTNNEKNELDRLQAEMLSYRRKVAPLPLQDLRDLHAELLRKVNCKSN